MGKKRIAVLTLRVDNNYGGNLQRYALVRVLQELGFDSTVLYFRSEWIHDPVSKKFKRFVKSFLKLLLGQSSDPLFYWKHEDNRWEETRSFTYPFFCNYVKHSPLIFSESSLRKHVRNRNYYGFIVGSDQVWRKAYTQRWGVEHFFLDFAPKGAKKIAYAASFGLNDMEYDERELERLRELYKRLDAVSVREDSGLEVLAKHGWNKPHAVIALDPTMLLAKEHYMKLIKQGLTKPSKGDLFCYILDDDTESARVISSIEKEKNYTSFYVSIIGKDRVSVEQWLRSFVDARCVVTDSYHGLVFSLVFNKPFYLIYNAKRGNARFESLLGLFDLSTNGLDVDWEFVNKRMEELRKESINFLIDNL